jgi:hypothetical protein
MLNIINREARFAVLSVVTPCSLIREYHHFGTTYCRSILNMNAAMFFRKDDTNPDYDHMKTAVLGCIAHLLPFLKLS